jgi:hypothetical protein
MRRSLAILWPRELSSCFPVKSLFVIKRAQDGGFSVKGVFLDAGLPKGASVLSVVLEILPVTEHSLESQIWLQCCVDGSDYNLFVLLGHCVPYCHGESYQAP